MITVEQAAATFGVDVGVIERIIARGMVTVEAEGRIDEASWAQFEEACQSKRWMLLASEEELRGPTCSNGVSESLLARDVTRRLRAGGSPWAGTDFVDSLVRKGHQLNEATPHLTSPHLLPLAIAPAPETLDQGHGSIEAQRPTSTETGHF